MYSWQFSKNFPSPKMAAILNFQILTKIAKHKFVSISLTVRDRAISSKFSIHKVSKKCTLRLGNFQKNFPLPTYGGHFEFSNFCQKWKNTNLLISLAVQNRVISLKLSSHRVSNQCTLGNFQ